MNSRVSHEYYLTFLSNVFFLSLRPPAPRTAACVPAAPPAPAAAAAATPGAETSPVLSCPLSRSLLFIFDTKVLHFFCVSSPSLDLLKATVMSAVSFQMFRVFLYSISIFRVLIKSMLTHLRLN